MLKVDARDLPVVDWAESRVAPVGNWVASAGPGEDPVAVGVVSVGARSFSPKELAVMAPPTGGGYLGIGLEDTDKGPRVLEVMKDNAAAKAGVKVGDVILSVSGKEIPDRDTLILILSRTKPGTAIKMKLRRGGEDMDLDITLGSRPAANPRGDFQNKLGSEL